MLSPDTQARLMGAAVSAAGVACVASVLARWHARLHPLAGDDLPMGPDRPVMRVEVLEPERTLAIRIADMNWVWIFALLPETGSTRLISRNRIVTAALPPAARPLYLLFMEPGSLVIERKMLLGIKARAERLARERAA